MPLPFDTLRLEGALFFPEILKKTALGDGLCQTPADYQLPKDLKLRDEYGRAFQIAQAQWKSFAAMLERKDRDPATQSRAFITEFLRDALGYSDIPPTAAVEIHARKYPVGTLAATGKLPVVIAPHTQELDTPDHAFAIEGGGARKKSPAQLLQEFLNASPDHTWGLVTNGRKIRLLRDSATLTRPPWRPILSRRSESRTLPLRTGPGRASRTRASPGPGTICARPPSSALKPKAANRRRPRLHRREGWPEKAPSCDEPGFPAAQAFALAAETGCPDGRILHMPLARVARYRHCLLRRNDVRTHWSGNGDEGGLPLHEHLMAQRGRWVAQNRDRPDFHLAKPVRIRQQEAEPDDPAT